MTTEFKLTSESIEIEEHNMTVIEELEVEVLVELTEPFETIEEVEKRMEIVEERSEEETVTLEQISLDEEIPFQVEELIVSEEQ